MDKIRYLRRIGIEETELKPNLENLKKLQRRHLLSAPFENLDIHWKRPIILDTDKFYGKIVENNRGGFCYELNGLFFELLTALGYESTIVSARVFNGKDFGAEYDHLAILTKIGDEKFLVDAGFGDFTTEPLKFVADEEQPDENGIFKITKRDSEYFEVFKKNADDWKSQYIFTDKARDLSEFSEMCGFHQISPESHFTRGKICSIATVDGRKTLSDKKFIQTRNGEKSEIQVNSEEDYNEILEREFKIRRNFL